MPVASIGGVQPPRLTVQRGHWRSVFAVAVSSDGLVVTADWDGWVVFWTEAGRELRRIRIDAKPSGALALSPDGRILLTGSKSCLYEAADGSVVRRLGDHAEPLSHAAFSADGALALTIGPDGGPRVWEVVSGKEVFHVDWVDTVDHGPAPRGDAAFSPDASSLDVVRADGILRRFDLASGRETKTVVVSPEPYAGAAFSRSGRLLVMRAGQSLLVADVESGRVRHAIDYDMQWLARSLAVSDDGRFALVGDGTTLYVWDVPEGRQLAEIGTKERWEDRAASLYSPLFLGEPARAILVGENERASQWDAATGERLVQYGGWLRGLDFAAWGADGRLVVTSGEWALRETWDVATGARAATESVTIEEQIPHKVESARSPDGHYSLTCEGGGQARVSDAATGREIARLQSESIRSVSFSPDGRIAITAGHDGAVRFWRVLTGERLGMLVRFDDRADSWLVVDTRGHFDVSGSAALEHLHWVKDGTPPVVLPAKAYPERLRPGLLAEVLRA